MNDRSRKELDLFWQEVREWLEIHFVDSLRVKSGWSIDSPTDAPGLTRQRLTSNEMIQMHGGIGMTDAHNAGFYLNRARSCAAEFGNQSSHRDRYARLNGY